jgi:hypothetical protein
LFVFFFFLYSANLQLDSKYHKQELEPSVVIGQAKLFIEVERSQTSTVDTSAASPESHRAYAIEMLSLLLHHVAEDPDWLRQPLIQTFLAGRVTSDAHLPRILKFYLAVISLINDAINEDIVPKRAFRTWAEELSPSGRLPPSLSAHAPQGQFGGSLETLPGATLASPLPLSSSNQTTDSVVQTPATMKPAAASVGASIDQQALWDKTWNRLSSKLSTARK